MKFFKKTENLYGSTEIKMDSFWTLMGFIGHRRGFVHKWFSKNDVVFHFLGFRFMKHHVVYRSDSGEMTNGNGHFYIGGKAYKRYGRNLVRLPKNYYGF